MEDHEKCTQQFVLNVKKNAKFPSNRTEADLFIAENVTLAKDLLEDIKLII
jgi:hypothetical protein